MKLLFVDANFLNLFCFITMVFSYADVEDNFKVVVQYKPDKCKRLADVGDKLYLHYTGYLESGEVFDSSKQHNQPLSIVLGSSNIIPGWHRGIHGMCVGEKRQLVIPPELAYGAEGHPPYIPGGATLTFDIELVGIELEGIGTFVSRLLRFLFVPFTAVCIVIYLYKKYKKFPTKKELKELRKNKKRN